MEVVDAIEGVTYKKYCHKQTTGTQQPIRDGVCEVGIAYALVIAVKASFEGPDEVQLHKKEWQ